MRRIAFSFVVLLGLAEKKENVSDTVVEQHDAFLSFHQPVEHVDECMLATPDSAH